LLAFIVSFHRALESKERLETLFVKKE